MQAFWYEYGGRIKAGLIGFVAFLLFLTGWLSAFTCKDYEQCVVTRMGKFDRMAPPGLNFKLPFIEGVTDYRIDLLHYQPAAAANTYTIDNQEVDVLYKVFYRIPPDRIRWIYQNAQDYQQRLSDMVVDRLKAEMGKVNVAHVSEQRGAIRDRIKDVLKADAARLLGIEVSDFQLSNLEYTKSYKADVEKAASARQAIVTAEWNRDQEKMNADRQRIKAQGEADSRLAVAKAEAESIELKGRAEAESIKAQADALRQNVNLVELRKAERWNGALPTQMLSNVMPIMEFKAPAGVAK